jgi:hypothetical protein
MKNLFDFDKLLEFLRKNTAVNRGSIRLYYLDQHKKNAGGVPEYQIRVTFSLESAKKPANTMMMGMSMSSSPTEYKQDFWCIGYDFKRVYTEGDNLFGGFLEDKDFVYLY